MATQRRGHACLVDGCTADLLSEPSLSIRVGVCDEHRRAPVILHNGQRCRYCQQCVKPHRLDEFAGARRSCKKMLERHNKRRKLKKLQLKAAASKSRSLEKSDIDTGRLASESNVEDDDIDHVRKRQKAQQIDEVSLEDRRSHKDIQPDGPRFMVGSHSVPELRWPRPYQGHVLRSHHQHPSDAPRRAADASSTNVRVHPGEDHYLHPQNRHASNEMFNVAYEEMRRNEARQMRMVENLHFARHHDYYDVGAPWNGHTNLLPAYQPRGSSHVTRSDYRPHQGMRYFPSSPGRPSTTLAPWPEDLEWRYAADCYYRR